MKQFSIKLLSILAIFLFIASISIVVLATTNENISIVETTTIVNGKEEKGYAIYIKDYTDDTKIFKYAFTTNDEPEEIDLSYIISDLGDNQAAFLDMATYEELSKENKPIYMWAKIEDEKGNKELILKGIQIDLNKALKEEDLKTVENLTKRIEVEIADSEEITDATNPVRQENIEGVEETAKVGYVKIVDDENATYYYERVKLPDSEQYSQLMELVEQAKNEYNEMDIYEKVQFATKFNEVYSTVTSEAKWQKVKNMTIEQPEESVAGDKYIVLLKKVAQQDEKEEITIDAQFLIAEDNYTPNVVKEEIVTQETTKLPITYDSIALFIILGIIVILAVLVFVRMKKINKQNEEK